ncbi:MAG: hypothetical protein M1832_004658 [Thelocarpon impressellum]|nr:MAG: hypothetical protein M1832_004658 [Thelocarpon impressellum]
MATYLNKIFAARADGGVDIWNLSTGKLIYTILPPTAGAGPVTALQPAPALSLLAIAYRDGPVIIHDVRTDVTVVQVNSTHSRRGLVSSISFRTDELGAGDDGRRAGVMATAGTESGDVTIWDLNDGGRVMGVLRGAHNPPSTSHRAVDGGVNRIEFLAGQPVLVTGGLDNALKSWIFDETPFSPVPRILHSRGGHAGPVTRLEFLPAGADGADTVGKWLLTAGEDRSLWGWSLRRDGQSTELSQGNIRKKAKKWGLLGADDRAADPTTSLEDLKAPAITCIASSMNRDGGVGAAAGGNAIWTNTRVSHNKKRTTDASSSSMTGWESVVTGHEGDKLARTWFWGRKKAGRWAFETGDGGVVKSVAITPCGTFALIGSSVGGIDMFNLQSGHHRQRFPPALTPAQARALSLEQSSQDTVVLREKAGGSRYNRGEGRHTKAVTGLMVDATNKTVISCGLDGKVKFWGFASGVLLKEVDWSLETALLGSRYHRPSELLGLSCDDPSIRVVDTVTGRLVRELWGPLGHITDFCFSSDGRWIVAASTDSVIRVWDLPTGHLIDAVKLESVCTALAFSSTGDFIATAQAGEIGVNIWTNRTLFSHVPTRRISEAEIAEIAMPTASGEGGQALVEAALVDGDEDAAPPDDTRSAFDSLSHDITTLSLVPKSRWQTLLHLDVIKERNKPKEPPKAPERAPFFLPSLEGPTKDTSVVEKQVPVANGSRLLKVDRGVAEREATVLLRNGGEGGDYGAFINHLKTLPPAAADLEIRALNPVYGSAELVLFVAALTSRLRQKMDYDLVQAWMSVFLRLHGEAVPQDASLSTALSEWRVEQASEAKRLGALMGYSAGVLAFLRSAR